ncbi:MAG: site-2 protease family protein [Acidobacteriota bacterium]
MKWSIRLGTFSGIDVNMHVTFLILVAWVVAAHWMPNRSLSDAVSGLVFILALFGCVVLHEFGHALTARQFGISTRDITLLPIGGVARLERMPEDPAQELWVALAGPMVNVVLAGVLAVVLAIGDAFDPFADLSLASGSLVERLLVVNVFLVLFNMLPAFPMDGGRVLRAILAMRMEYTRATHYAAMLGQALALAFGLIGLFSNPFLVFIALFVWIGAAEEVATTQMKSALSGIPLERAMITNFRTLRPTDSLAAAVDMLLSGSQQEFPVIEDEAVVGVLTRTDLLAALAQGGDQASVASVMRRDFLVADPSDMIDRALERVQGRACQTILVLRRGVLVGIVTMENLGEFVSVQAALSGLRIPLLRH